MNRVFLKGIKLFTGIYRAVSLWSAVGKVYDKVLIECTVRATEKGLRNKIEAV